MLWSEQKAESTTCMRLGRDTIHYKHSREIYQETESFETAR